MQRAHVRRINPEFARLTADDIAIYSRMRLSAEFFYRASDCNDATACTKRMQEGRTAVTQTVRALDPLAFLQPTNEEMQLRMLIEQRRENALRGLQ